jgi:1-acyl-sn-glycerol-3-phosphate acyltransferase
MFAPERKIRFYLKVYARLFNRSCIVNGYYPLPHGPKIIAINHTDGCDPLLLPLLLDEKPYFLLQNGLFKIPLIGRLLKQAGQIPVYRETERARDAYEQACELLRQGKTIVIFPEGKQVPAGERIRAKTGTVRMSLQTGAPIVPLGLYVPPENLVNVKFNFQGRKCYGLWQASGKSYARFGEPWIVRESLTESDQPNVHALTEELMNRIYRLVTDIEKEIPCESHFLHRFIRPWSVERL